jgi:Fic family protein
MFGCFGHPLIDNGLIFDYHQYRKQHTFTVFPSHRMIRVHNTAGKKVALGAYSAFVPAPLAPKLEWTARLIGVLSETDRLIGRLSGEGARLPNPHILMRPFVRREAVLSSKIEGTQATLGELLASEAGAVVERSPEDLREVGNYIVALEHGIALLRELPLCVRLVRELHEKLMKGARGQHATPGPFRTTQNWIGKPGSTLATATFIPPPPGEVEPCLAAWEKFLHESDLPPLVTVALAHYQFEAIHPFLDGNGRVGRLLITVFLIERKILPTPLLYLSAFFEATRRDYYENLRGVSDRGHGRIGWSISCWGSRACPRMLSTGRRASMIYWRTGAPRWLVNQRIRRCGWSIYWLQIPSSRSPALPVN